MSAPPFSGGFWTSRPPEYGRSEAVLVFRLTAYEASSSCLLDTHSWTLATMQRDKQAMWRGREHAVWLAVPAVGPAHQRHRVPAV